jgi:hypothetical protein
MNNYYNKYIKYQNKNELIEQNGGFNLFSKKVKPEIINPDIGSLPLLETKEFKFSDLSVKIEKYGANVFVKGHIDYNGSMPEKINDSNNFVVKTFTYILVNDKYILLLNYPCYSNILNQHYFSDISLDTLKKLRDHVCTLEETEAIQKRNKEKEEKLIKNLEIFDSNPKNDSQIITKISQLDEYITKTQKTCNELKNTISNKDNIIDGYIKERRANIVKYNE